MTTTMLLLADINPTPWTAPQAAVGRKGGKAFPRLYSSAELKAYKAAVSESAREIVGDEPPTEEDVALIFYFWRQLPDYETDRERRARKHEADATNLQKATEDALQGILFKNDKQVIGVTSWIMEQGHGTRPAIGIIMEINPERPTPKISLEELDLPIALEPRDDLNVEEIF